MKVHYGRIFYESINHLGNVQVVVSDKRISVCDSELEVEYFKACTTHDKSTENRDEYSFLPEF